METLNLIYMIRIFLGFLAAVLCILLGVNDIITGLALSLAMYIGTDRILRQIFIEKVKKQSDITKTGIGIYIISWIMFWILIYTILNPIGA
ncbi:MAG: hypothetical protein RMJ07_05960 [Nitrososphaerota archaeon]|nr:hypothetical protein [Candidatus Bathyarchaeota archaeon]MDW8049203.1 hypothetical protein [Nitrososphaerota archaeon]